jgi:hypothetical protein
MNRLVRIALSLFVSATLLVFVINRRLQGLPKIAPGDRLSDQEADRIHNEVLMLNVGFIVIAVMLVVGLGLLITALLRARKSKSSDPASHG